MIRGVKYAAALAAGAALAEAVLIHLGQTFGSTRRERATRLPGDQIVSEPQGVRQRAEALARQRSRGTHSTQLARRTVTTRGFDTKSGILGGAP
jgi:hypothetical protein